MVSSVFQLSIASKPPGRFLQFHIFIQLVMSHLTSKNGWVDISYLICVHLMNLIIFSMVPFSAGSLLDSNETAGEMPNECLEV